jgi:UDP-2-acetamido-3-amino-2,3-dideoxy-glucuronate N-acetyltransferase
MQNPNFFVHQSSIIDEDVQIGSNTFIWHFCHLSEGVKIGENCSIGQNVFIGKNVKIGNGVKIQNNVSVFEGVEIEDDVFVGPSVVFTNVVNPRAFINRKQEFKKTIVKRGASLGAHTTVICGNTIGKYALIGAGSVITKNVADFELWYGNPAKKHGVVDKEGNKVI